MKRQAPDPSKISDSQAAEWLVAAGQSWTLESLYISNGEFDRDSLASDRKRSQ